MTSTNEFEEEIAASGLKMTEQRRVIAGVMASAEDHPDVYQVFERAHAKDNSISMATVYRTVKLLEENGLIEKRDFGDGRARYEASHDHHHHIIDLESGDVIEFKSDEIEKLKEKIAADYGYDLVECHLELYCRPKAKNGKTKASS